MSEYFPSWAQWLRGAGRAVIFVVGGVAALAGLFVGGNYDSPVLGYVEMVILLVLALATPVLFCLATFGKSGDTWTVRYLLAWFAYIIAYCVAALVATVT